MLICTFTAQYANDTNGDSFVAEHRWLSLLHDHRHLLCIQAKWKWHNTFMNATLFTAEQKLRNNCNGQNMCKVSKTSVSKSRENKLLGFSHFCEAASKTIYFFWKNYLQNNDVLLLQLRWSEFIYNVGEVLVTSPRTLKHRCHMA